MRRSDAVPRECARRGACGGTEEDDALPKRIGRNEHGRASPIVVFSFLCLLPQSVSFQSQSHYMLTQEKLIQDLSKNAYDAIQSDVTVCIATPRFPCRRV